MIEAFWEWFKENEPKIKEIALSGSAAEQAWLKEQLDQHILSIGKFSWEINQGEQSELELVISPNRDYDLFKTSKKVISESPSLENWSFLASKKANLALDPFELYDVSIELRTFQPSQWQVKVDGKTIEVFDPSFEKIDDETCLFAAQIALSSYMGEARYMQEVSKVLVSHLPDSTSKPIQSLHKA